MLDLMRAANRNKWFVWLVIMFVVVSFVIAVFAIWGGAATRNAAEGDLRWAARVGDTVIPTSDFQRHRQQVESQYRNQLGDQFDSITSQLNLNFDQIALSQLIGQTLAYNEAVRLGLSATDAEVSRAIRTSPLFQRGGRFIGREQYINELRGRGYDVAEYEEQVGRDLTVDKLREIVGSMVQVTDADVEEAFRQEGQTAEVDYVLFRESDYASSKEPTTAEVEKWFREHRSDYVTPEKRSAVYVLIERQPLLGSVEVTDAEIQQAYDQSKETLYTTPEQWRASHILFKVPADASPADVEAIRKKAEDVLAQVKAGGDFAELAKQYSEDSSASNGGDLGWFGRGRMVPEFEQATLALSDGEVSDLVKSQFGFHIIKRTGSRPAGERPLDEVRDQIRQQIAFRKAQEMLETKAKQFQDKLSQQTSSFETTATELGYTVHDTGMFAKNEPIPELGPAPQVADQVFSLKPTETSGPIAATKGTVFVHVTDVQPPEPAPFDTVKDKVKADYVKSRAIERAREAARTVAEASPAEFKSAADRKKVQVQSTDEFRRSSAPAVFNDAVKDAIFSHPAGEVIGPFDTSEGVVVVRLVKRGPDSDEAIAQTKQQLRDKLLQQRRDDAFLALLQKLQTATPPEVNPALIDELGKRASR